MKHDLCANPILVSQLPDTDVSPAFIHRHTRMPGCNTCIYVSYTYIYIYLLTLHFDCLNLTFITVLLSPTDFLICFSLHFFCLCPQPHPFPLVFITFTLPPYIVTHIPLYGINVVPLPSFPPYFCLFLFLPMTMSVTPPPLQQYSGYTMLAFVVGDGWSCLAERF